MSTSSLNVSAEMKDDSFIDAPGIVDAKNTLSSSSLDIGMLTDIVVVAASAVASCLSGSGLISAPRSTGSAAEPVIATKSVQQIIAMCML